MAVFDQGHAENALPEVKGSGLLVWGHVQKLQVGIEWSFFVSIQLVK